MSTFGAGYRTMAWALPGLLLCASPARAEQPGAAEMQRRLAEQDARIAELEARLSEQARVLASLVDARGPPGAEAALPSLAQALPPAPPPASAPALVRSVAVPPLLRRPPALDLSGDLRLRQEFNVSDPEARDRTRSVVRARLRASYAIADRWSAGLGAVTGDADDPNTADVTLSGFADDLTVALDQAWLRYAAGDLALMGGKFANPFLRTDMVWDGDVNPQGAAASWSARAGKAQVDLRGLYFVLDEKAGGRDSAMLGAQLAVSAPLAPDWNASIAAAYYAYQLNSLTGADAGDFRSNLFADGRYLSDFRLIDAIASLSYTGLSEAWPLSATFDYIHNTGAVAGSDGFNLELAAGRAREAGEWKLGGSYSEVGVDAVFAAFSHDNLAMATNYQLLSISLEHALQRGLSVSAVLYHYQPLKAEFAGFDRSDDWRDRIRINLMAQF